MNKLITLFLTLFFIGQPMMGHAAAAKEKRDDSRYLAGAVPVIDGKVVFSKEFQVPGKSQKDIYNTALGWMNKRLKANGNEQSRVVYTDESTYTIAGRGEEWIVFRSRPLWLDRTWVEYQITAVCQAGKCEIRLEKIRYTYQENLHYTAEEWITDEMALNKKKTKLAPICGKFRRETIDLKDALFSSVRECLGQKILDSPADNKTQNTTDKKTGVVAVSELPGNLGEIIANGKLVIKTDSKETELKADSWGGFGKLFNKDVAYILIDKKQSELNKNMESSTAYTVSFYNAKDKKAEVTIECKKTMTQELSAEELKSLNQDIDTSKKYIMYICEVISARIE